MKNQDLYTAERKRFIRRLSRKNNAGNSAWWWGLSTVVCIGYGAAVVYLGPGAF